MLPCREFHMSSYIICNQYRVVNPTCNQTDILMYVLGSFERYPNSMVYNHGNKQRNHWLPKKIHLYPFWQEYNLKGYTWIVLWNSWTSSKDHKFVRVCLANISNYISIQDCLSTRSLKDHLQRSQDSIVHNFLCSWPTNLMMFDVSSFVTQLWWIASMFNPFLFVSSCKFFRPATWNLISPSTLSSQVDFCITSPPSLISTF